MKIKILVLGFLMILFGLANIFWYLPDLGITLKNHPFPFQHLAGVVAEHGGHTIIVDYLPIKAAIEDPYWLFWSLSLYAGMVISCAVGIKMIRK